MQRSFACLSLIACLVAPLAVAAQAVDGGVVEAQGPPAPEAPSAPEEQLAPEAPADSRGQVLVLPSRTPVDAGIDGATLDVLLASAFQELGFEVRDAEVVCEQLDQDAPTLDPAREAYLDMDLEGALEHAAKVRDAHLAHQGDLLADPSLEAAELFLVQVLIDLGRQTEAAEIAARVLTRRPSLRLDAADHSPSMLALWSATVLGQAGRDPQEPSTDELEAFGRQVGVDWVVVGVWRSAPDLGNRLVVQVVPIGGDEEPSRHDVVLGPRARWAVEVRKALLERFPPPAPPVVPPPAGGPLGPTGPAGGNGDQIDGDTEWYKTWWFWTIVGAVVVGGTAGAVGGYYATREEERPTVDGNPW
jgi:hypothetical protein